MLLVRKIDLLVRGAISSSWRIENPRCVSYIIGSIMVGAVTGDLVVVLVGLIMVGVKLVESLAGVKGVGAIAVDLAKVLVKFIVVN